MHTSYPLFSGSFQSNMVAVAANGTFLARCASQPNEPSTALAALLNIDPDLELCFSNGLDAPLLCHRVILRLSSTVMRDILTGSGGSSKEVSPRSSDSQHPKKPAGQGLLSPEPSASSDSDSSRYTGTLKVDGSRAAWLQILMRCYALHPAAVDDLVGVRRAYAASLDHLRTGTATTGSVACVIVESYASSRSTATQTFWCCLVQGLNTLILAQSLTMLLDGHLQTDCAQRNRQAHTGSNWLISNNRIIL